MEWGYTMNTRYPVHNALAAPSGHRVLKELPLWIPQEREGIAIESHIFRVSEVPHATPPLPEARASNFWGVLNDSDKARGLRGVGCKEKDQKSIDVTVGGR